jgi:hypothetical protein
MPEAVIRVYDAGRVTCWKRDSRAFPKEVKSMKRKITGAILISLGLGFFGRH